MTEEFKVYSDFLLTPQNARFIKKKQFASLTKLLLAPVSLALRKTLPSKLLNTFYGISYKSNTLDGSSIDCSLNGIPNTHIF
jgi:hypothetical protein